jgi:thiol-disulfide isomerase/thioredoxin
MKKLSLLALFVAVTVAFSACKKTEETTPTGGGDNTPTIAQEQNAVAFYLSGIWCGPCGQYGKPAMKNVKDKFGDKLIVVACHLSSQSFQDPYNIPAANALAGAWNVTGVPTCAIGAAGKSGMKIGGGPNMQSGIENQFNTLISNTATTGTLVDAKIENGEIKISSKTKFFGSSTEEHFMSVYITESNIAGRQYVSGSGWDNSAVHNDVLRVALTTAATGDSFATSATDGQEFTKEFTTSLDAAWNKDNLKAVVVIWKQGANGRVLVNGSASAVK